jgi:DNA mismatch endonuclease, patch repair protein
MTDKVSPGVRSRIMSRVRQRDTRTELTLRRALWAAGVRGWRCNDRTVVGTPDLVWKSRGVAVFIDSAWWHGHPSRWTPGRLPPHWDRKIQANRDRDRWVTDELKRQGWTVVRVWDFELHTAMASCIRRVTCGSWTSGFEYGAPGSRYSGPTPQVARGVVARAASHDSTSGW